MDRHKGRKIVRGDSHCHAEPMGYEFAVPDPAVDCSLRYVQRISDLIDREKFLRCGAAGPRDTRGTSDRSER
jgi:hypothetical protein